MPQVPSSVSPSVSPDLGLSFPFTEENRVPFLIEVILPSLNRSTCFTVCCALFHLLPSMGNGNRVPHVEWKSFFCCIFCSWGFGLRQAPPRMEWTKILKTCFEEGVLKKRRLRCHKVSASAPGWHNDTTTLLWHRLWFLSTFAKSSFWIWMSWPRSYKLYSDIPFFWSRCSVIL